VQFLPSFDGHVQDCERIAIYSAFFLRSAHRCFINWDNFLLPSGVNRLRPLRSEDAFRTEAVLWRAAAAALCPRPFDLPIEVPSNIVIAWLIRFLSAFNSETIL